MEDIGLALADLVGSMENVPSELRHLFTEITELDEKYEEAMGRAWRDERSLQRELKESGNREQAGEREEQLVGQISKEHQSAASLCQEKQRLTRKAMGIVHRHLAKLDTEIRRYDKTSGDKQRSLSRFGALDTVGMHSGEQSPAFHLPAQKRMEDLLSLDSALDDPDAFYTPSRGPKRRQHGANRPPQRKKQLKLASSILSLDGIEVDANTAGIEESDDQLYCFCQQVSYGDMVACDGPECRHEWFHWECVGLSSPPKGSWYCSECLAKLLAEGDD